VAVSLRKVVVLGSARDLNCLRLMIHAVAVFIVPTVGAIVFGLFWRHQRARVRSRYGDRMRETQRQLPIERAHDENWRAF
jgi:hypothetical protein